MAPPFLANESTPMDYHRSYDDALQMIRTYNELARDAIQAFADKRRKRAEVNQTCEAVCIAVVGGPGAGKSTVAEEIAIRVIQFAGDADLEAIVVPMDGYHYTQEELVNCRDVKNGTTRRGAPWTFNAEALYDDLTRARYCGEIMFPGYSRKLSDPVPGMVKLEKKHKIVLVEGNWLMLGHLRDNEEEEVKAILEASGLDCPRPIADEIGRWEPLLSLWDECWYVEPPGGVEEQKERVLERSLKTWTSQKTRDWGGDTAIEAATRRTESNDLPNARLVACCRKFADRLIVNI